MKEKKGMTGQAMDTQALQLIKNAIALREEELSMVTEFVRRGLEHDTIVEAVYQALKAASGGASIRRAMQLAEDEWYK